MRRWVIRRRVRELACGLWPLWLALAITGLVLLLEVLP